MSSTEIPEGGVKRDPTKESPNNIRFAAQAAVWQLPELTEEQVAEKIRQAFDPSPHLVTADSDGNGTFWIVVIPAVGFPRVEFSVYTN